MLRIDATIGRAAQTLPLRVQVANFTDERAELERERKARKDQGFSDVNDFTYDKTFIGVEADEISNMIVAHLKFAKIFSEVSLGSIQSGNISDSALSVLAQQNIDAVLVGEIEHFYGYYDLNPGRQFLYGFGLGLALGLPVYLATGPTEETTRIGNMVVTETRYNTIPGSIATSVGVTLGYYLESTHKRDIERHVGLSARLIRTATHETLWENRFEVAQKEHKSMPGFNTETRKAEVTVAALREAVNNMVQSLSAMSGTN